MQEKDNEQYQMIAFQKLNEKTLREFAGNVVFNRGHDYYTDELVEDFEFDPEKNTIRANIHGRMGIYSIEVWEHNQQIEANCDCPFDGFPCKHIVAVLLYYLQEKDSYLKNLDKEQKVEKLVRDKLLSFEKDKLIKIILTFVKKYPPFKRELFLLLSIDKEATLKQFFKEIDKVFRAFDRDTFSTHEICHRLHAIIKQTDTAASEIKVEVIWKITDSVLHQLNEFGMNDIPLENIAIQGMDQLTEILISNPNLMKRRAEIHDKLDEYCNWGNCGIVDNICEAMFELSNENS